MFKGIKNIASEIRSEVSGETSGQSNYLNHSHSHSQSSSSSRTRRFLSSNRSSNGSSINFNKKSKEYGELDGRTEEDTVVHKSLVKFFKDQGKDLPEYLRTGNNSHNNLNNNNNYNNNNITTKRSLHESSKSTSPQATSKLSNNIPQPKPNLNSMQTPIQTREREPTYQAQRPSQQPVQQHIPDRPVMRKAATETYTSHSFDNEIKNENVRQPQRFIPQRTQTQGFVNTTSQSQSSSRFHSRFSGNGGGGGSINGGSSSRFGRKVQ
jgi:hypothetical protein